MRCSKLASRPVSPTGQTVNGSMAAPPSSVFVKKVLCQHRAEPMVGIVRVAYGIGCTLAHQADDADIHSRAEPVNARQQRTRHINKAVARGHTHDLGFHLLTVQDLHILFQVGQRRHQAVAAPVGACGRDDVVRRRCAQDTAAA